MKQKEPKKNIIGSAKQFEQNLPDIVKKYGIRVSGPHGCYPEDVANILEKLEAENNLLAKENTTLTAEAEKFHKQYKEVLGEFNRFKMQVSTFSLKDTTLEQDIAMTEGITAISMAPKRETKPEAEPKEEPKKSSIKLNPVKISGIKSSGSSSNKSTFDNFISPKKKE